MAYTIDFAYTKYLDKIDRSGEGDFLPVPMFLEQFITECYSFIESVVPFIEANQKLRDALLPLSKGLDLLCYQNPKNSSEQIGILPDDYLHLEVAKPEIPGKTIREHKLIRKGELFSKMRDPHHKPTDEYPLIIEYGDYLAVYGSSVAQGVKVKGFYLAQPDFGNPYVDDLTGEVLVNLPDQVAENVMNMMATAYFRSIGDPRYEASLRQDMNFGKKH